MWYRRTGYRSRYPLMGGVVETPPARVWTPVEPFMASQTLVPIYETGTALTDVFVGALYIDTTSSFYARALIGSTLSGTEVRVKVKTTYSTSDSATANIVTSTSLALVEQSESSPFSLTAGSYAYFYITCAAAGASWQCPAITLTMVELV